MKITVAQLRQIIREEVSRSLSATSDKRLSEGHARITQAEIEAWRQGDWGFVSEDVEHEDD